MAFLFSSGKDREKWGKNVAEERLKDLLETLKDINSRLVEMQERIDTIERVLAERLPPDILTERTFREEVKGGDEITKEIIAKVEDMAAARTIRDVIEERLVESEKPTHVETRRIETITGLLQQSGKLSSDELSRQLGLSRTRCNEYFKQMEEMGIVEPVLIGREKFYRLS